MHILSITSTLYTINEQKEKGKAGKKMLPASIPNAWVHEKGEIWSHWGLGECHFMGQLASIQALLWLFKVTTMLDFSFILALIKEFRYIYEAYTRMMNITTILVHFHEVSYRHIQWSFNTMTHGLSSYGFHLNSFLFRLDLIS